jgi:hypothetical protein
MPDIRMSDFGGIPYGNSAGRPVNPGVGKLYSNGQNQRLELYTSNGSWENIIQEVPGISSISGQYLETNNSNTLTIIGTNFVDGAIAYAVGTNAVEVAATSTTFNSLVQLTAVFSGLTAVNEPYDIKVINPSNLFGLLPDALFVNNQVVWTTASGSLGSFGDEVAISVSATASDDSTITYAVAAGSSLPSGITLNTSTGLISGTLPNVNSNTTYTFTLTASDGSNPAVSRQFNFTSNAAPIWTTSAGSLGDFTELNEISVTVAATDITDTVTYQLANGSSLPSGLTLNSSTGVISGTLPDISENTTYTFTINASDGINNVPRTFSILSRYSLNIEYLVVAGGGSGGSGHGGGGGAGGYRAGSLNISSGSHQIVVGVGGVAGLYGQSSGSLATDSRLGPIYATAGGVGGAQNMPGFRNPGTGGSGGGGAVTTDTPQLKPGAAGNAGGYNPVEGYAGGTPASQQWHGAGGGGSSGPGTYTGSRGGGGPGTSNSITGSAVTYAAGGSGQANTNDAETGGANTGNGGGGTRDNTAGNGGSGIVVIAYSNTLPPITTIPGTLTYDQPTRSGYRVYRFTAGTGTITF